MSPATRKQSQGPIEKVYFPSSGGFLYGVMVGLLKKQYALLLVTS
jgi:hypothetical protein